MKYCLTQTTLILSFSLSFFFLLSLTDMVFGKRVAFSLILGMFYKELSIIEINTRKK